MHGCDATDFQIALQFLFQAFEKPGHGDDHRNPFRFDRFNHFTRVQRVLKVNFALQEWRHQNSHELTEDVAQRNQVQKPHRVKPAFPAQVLLDFLFERCQVREQVTMRQANAPRFGSGSGSKNDLDKIVRFETAPPAWTSRSDWWRRSIER